MILSFTFVHTVQVKTKAGNGFKGETWAAPVSVQCWVEDTSEDVLSPDGNIVTASAKVFAALSDQAKITLGSDVTLPSGRTAQVLKVGVYDSGTLQLGLDHVEAWLK